MSHHILSRFWWILLGRGATGILFGLAALGWFFYLELSPRDPFGSAILLEPLTALATLLLFLGLYAFMDGLFSILLGAQDFGDGHRWWGLLACGLFTCALGAWTWVHPDPGLMLLFCWIVVWALVSGFQEFLQSFNKTEYRDRKKQFFYAGLFSMAFALCAVLFRGGGNSLLFMTGIYALSFGIPVSIMGFRLRGYSRKNAV